MDTGNTQSRIAAIRDLRESMEKLRAARAYLDAQIHQLELSIDFLNDGEPRQANIFDPTTDK